VAEIVGVFLSIAFCWPDWTASVVLSGMATKRGLTVWRCAFLSLLAGSCLVCCGGNAKIGGTGVDAGSDSDGGLGTPGTPSEAARPPGPGWSIRDATPYSRTEHATVLDEARDRMLVIRAAGGLDVWALPLSGPGKQQWAQILGRRHLYALTLRGEPTWHRFCESGIGMPGSISLLVNSAAPAPLLSVAPDGLFAALGDGAFRFDLATPYCAELQPQPDLPRSNPFAFAVIG
jgi:hypothetical protein